MISGERGSDTSVLHGAGDASTLSVESTEGLYLVSRFVWWYRRLPGKGASSAGQLFEEHLLLFTMSRF